MAIFHHSIKLISRGKSKSAVASSAYRSGTKMTNEYDGITHDYTSKGGIYSSAILLPSHAPKEYADRSTLWNAVEKIEKQHNAQLARDIEVAIPKEIPSHLWQRMLIDYCKTNFVSKGMIADLSIHNNDENNPHCHIMLTVRPIKEDGTWGAKSHKEYILDDSGNRIKLPSGNWKSTKVDTMDWNSQDNAEVWRANWSEHCNLYLENLGHTERIDHRSYERQGIDQVPTIHMGVSASQMEQKGIETDRGNINRQINDDNKEVKIIRARITRLMKWQRELEVQPLDFSRGEFKASILEKLNTNKGIIKNQYQTTKDLKNYVNVWNFLQANDIGNLEEFNAKIQAMNDSFYAVKSALKTIENDMGKLDRQLDLWAKYEQLKPMRKKYMKLTGKEQKAFYEQHTNELDRAEILNSKWVKFTNSGGKISTSTWKRERKELEQLSKTCDVKMKAYIEELEKAEKIQKALDELFADIKQIPTKIKDAER
ncbi:MobQ family relaxase [Chakrabartyella piscis]|uniref:MobQ family relaxase n=1 Tax=Chakrabartyella piscis TaxID=2918914 RepID=UPI0029583BC2|nr:MobQ family relaxase [Chakrabartyella piscis]